MIRLGVTGTDTGVGKTWVSAAILYKFRQQGKTVQTMKPVASGCTRVADQWQNEDALWLQTFTEPPQAYAEINPYAFEPAIGPHIAAQQADCHIDFAHIQQQYQSLLCRSDRLVMEGVGGWQVPLTEMFTVADLVVRLQLPVLLVVGLRLGCMNHALLTYQSIIASGARCVGWVANHLQASMPCVQENIDSMAQRIDAPLLGEIPFCESWDAQRVSEGIWIT